MTIIEAIEKIDSLKPNTYTNEEKIHWLSRIEGMIKRNCIDNHEGAENVVFDGYNEDTPVDTILIVQEPYDDLYLLWLEAMIDYTNGEFTKYNNVIIRYNDMYQAFFNDYNRTHMPKGTHIRYY
jgi:hypothetical protein